ncbi:MULTISPECIES: hypothetical protein [Streptococcus]|uniref:Transposase n=1 Tax=Streptococcus caledonicus TaxID=2614158 RepID=A0ABW0UI33_9STRE|nr:hypothetical protein [Streptococcus sp. S784/96/1]
MSKRSPKSVEEKLEIVLKYQEGQSIRQLIKEYHIRQYNYGIDEKIPN